MSMSICSQNTFTVKLNHAL